MSYAESALKEVEHSSLLLKSKFSIVIFLQKAQYGNVGEEYFTVEKSGKNYFSQVIGVNINSNKLC